MKNPFPGMNPWLELHWRETQTALLVYARDQLQPKLPQGLRAHGRSQQGQRLTFDIHAGVLSRVNA